MLHGVLHRLLSKAVLELKGGDRQPIDEEGQIERQRRLITAVAQLPGYAKAVQGIALGGLGVARRRGSIKEIQMMRAVFDAMTQHIDHAALADLSLQAGEKFLPDGAGVIKVESFNGFRLSSLEKFGKLHQIDGIFPVIIVPVA